MESRGGGVGVVLKGVPVYNGDYIQYNILGNLFEVSSKYVPPIQPVGRGAYGIVWYDHSIRNFLSFFFFY